MTSEPFNFWNEKKAYDLEGFVSCLNEMSDEEFSSYVNNSKNDFANWIEYSIQNIELAEKIKPLLDKDSIKSTVSDFISAEQNKLMIGTTKVVQDDSLVKEVMQKNEDFFKNAAEAYKKENPEPDKKEILESDKKENNELSKEKGSKLSLIDLPLLKKNKSENKSEVILKRKSENRIGQDFLAGIIFGLIIGALLTLIAIQLL